ncbi:MAG TPA: diguanylate cyclase [Magnetovibrio sp.]
MTEPLSTPHGAAFPGTAERDVIHEMSSYAVSDILDALSDFVCVCIDGNIRHVNAPGVAILGATNQTELLGRPFQSLICEDFAATIDDILGVMADERDTTPMRVKGINGKLESLAVRVKSLPDLGDHAYVVMGQNLTRQVELSEALHQGEVRFRKLVHSALDLICVLDDGIISYINQAGMRLLKAAHEDEVVGQPLRTFLHPDYQQILDGDITELADEDSLISIRLRDISQNNIDGEVGITVLENDVRVRCMIEVRDITGHNRAVTALRQSIETLEQRVRERTSALQDEVAERRRAEEMLRHVASHDPLTDLPNRSLLMDRLDKAINRAHRDNKKCAVMFIDLDGFKPINDTLGHDMGDVLLRVVAERLTDTIRETDTAARFGGDEFVLILSDLNKDDDTVPVAEKVLNALRMPVDLKGNEARIGASIGIAMYPDHGLTAEAVLKQADIAMYGVKEGGKNGYAMPPIISE